MALFQQAMIHKSAAAAAGKQNGAMKKPSNERLEFLGDSVLDLAVASYLFERFPDQNEGFMTKIRIRLINGITVASYARHLGLTKYVCLSRELEKLGGRNQQALLEDAFEAWLGALFLTCGFEQACKWMIAFMEMHVDFCDTIMQHRDYKDMLVKHFQAVYKCLPIFEDRKTRDGKTFSVAILDKVGRIVATGSGTSRRQAEALAAKSALRYYGFF